MPIIQLYGPEKEIATRIIVNLLANWETKKRRQYRTVRAIKIWQQLLATGHRWRSATVLLRKIPDHSKAKAKDLPRYT